MATVPVSIDMMMVLFRGIVLVVAALAGCMSIYLGWRLYRDGMLSKVEADAAHGGWTLRLSAAGPGVFFALFGMWLLVHLVNQRVDLQETTGPTGTPAHTTDSGLPSGEFDDLLIRAQTKAKPAKESSERLTCVVAVKKRSFGGGDELTADKLKADLEVARGAIKQSIKQAADEDAARRLQAADFTLYEVSSAAGSWELR